MQNASDVLFSAVAGLRAYGFSKRDSILDAFVKFLKFWESHFYRRLLPISSNILDISLTLLAINQLSHDWLSVQDPTKDYSQTIQSVYLENI